MSPLLDINVMAGKRISVERTYSAPVSKVWRAWTDGAQWGSWFSEGSAQVDLRVGGRYSTADGDTGVYREVARNERLSFTWEHAHHAATSPGSVVTLTFSAIAPRQTKLRLTHSGLAEQDAADLKQGWSWALASLEQYLRTGEPLKHGEWEAQQKSVAAAKPVKQSSNGASAKTAASKLASASNGALGAPRPQTGARLPLRWEELLNAKPEKVWRALTDDIDAWWTHGFNDMAPVVLEARVGGRFYEAFDDTGNGALFGMVTFCDPPKVLRFTGSLGMQGAVMNTVAFELQPVGDQTRLRGSMDTVGAPEDKVMAAYRKGWKELMRNLRLWLEEGRRSVAGETI